MTIAAKTIAANNSLDFTDEQAMILDSARQFCAARSGVAAVRALLGSESGFDPDVWRQMAELGWLGLAVPEAYGGSGLGFGATVPLAESMGRHLLATPFFSSALAARLLLRAGTAAQRETWLPRIVGGAVATPAMLDGEDWGAPAFAATAVERDGQLQLSGDKWHVQDAAAAELFLVGVELDGAAAVVLLERERLPAGALSPHVLIDETKRACRLSLEGVSVPTAQLLERDATPAALRDLELLGALLCAAESTGAAAACLDTVVEYLKTRRQFGRLIGSYQALKHPAVDVLCAVDDARSFIYHAATLVGDGGADRGLDEDTEIACRMAKAQAADALEHAGDRAVQFHGAMGFTYECDAQLYIRRAQWARQHYGDARHHRKRLASLLLPADLGD